MSAHNLTADKLRADIAAMLEEEQVEIGDHSNIIDLGLDSVRAMNLVLQWEEEGVPLDFADLAEEPTIAGLWACVQERLEAEAP